PLLRKKFMKLRKNGLFTQALLALTFVSLVPVLLIVWHVMRADSRVLQSEILDRQRIMADQIGSIVADVVEREVQFFSVFTDLHNDFTDHHYINQQDIEYLRLKNPSITHISVLNNKGRQLFHSSDQNSRFTYAPELANILKTCVGQGKEYVGSVSRNRGRLLALMAFPIREATDPQKVSGVLLAEMDLAQLGKDLSKVYNEDFSVAILSGDNGLISYSGVPGGLALQDNNLLKAKIDEIEKLLAGKDSAIISLPDQDELLVSRVKVPALGWFVYVYQQANTGHKLFMESTFHSRWDMLWIISALAGFVVLVAYLVIRPIVRPVQRLTEVAVKFEREKGYLPTESELIIPNNEIGELQRVFLHMARSLVEQKNEILAAQKELGLMNKDLELRVQERTAELKAATDELVKSEQLAAIGQMASIISHEIRNPLAVISNATRLIKTITPPTDPKLIKQFSIIEAEIKQANSIISEVLGFARSRELMLSMIDLNSYVHDIVASYPAGPEVRLVEELDQESVRLKIDAEEIKQALRNLLSNACEATPSHGSVRVGTLVGKKAVCIYIEDEGPGISPEMKEKIFSPFFTTKARGTGLGLAVVHKAVKRHKGKIFIHSEEGKGTCFAIYLRVYKKTGDTKYD
ncbi:MAG: hypothetical protein IKJ44_05830, partial [Elusimicrobiaceae bacterium]|nr:hypothetical protein [Elusimicrobiaceae bacterium]